jgi:hypothetical protein
MSWSRRRKTVAAVIGFVMALAMGIGIAAFITSVNWAGSNSGAFKTTGGPTGVTAGSTLTSAQVPTSLSPGQTGPLYIVVNNSAPGAQTLKLASWTPQPSTFVKAVSDGTCDASSFDFATLTGLNISVPPGVSTVALPGAITLHLNPQPGCSNGYFNLGGTADFTF